MHDIFYSAMKAWLRGNQDYVLSKLSGQETSGPYRMLWDAVFQSMTPENIVGVVQRKLQLCNLNKSFEESLLPVLVIWSK